MFEAGSPLLSYNHQSALQAQKDSQHFASLLTIISLGLQTWAGHTQPFKGPGNLNSDLNFLGWCFTCQSIHQNQPSLCSIWALTCKLRSSARRAHALTLNSWAIFPACFRRHCCCCYCVVVVVLCCCFGDRILYPPKADFKFAILPPQPSKSFSPLLHFYFFCLYYLPKTKCNSIFPFYWEFHICSNLIKPLSFPPLNFSQIATTNIQTSYACFSTTNSGRKKIAIGLQKDLWLVSYMTGLLIL